MQIKDIFGWFSAGPAAAEKALDAGIRGVDALIFTEEEKAEVRSKLADQWVELQKLLGEETTVRAVTRRILSVMFSGTYLGISVGSIVVWKFDREYADFMWEIANGQLGYITLAVAAFYFGPYFLSQLFGKKAGT